MLLPFWPNPSNYHKIELGLNRTYELLARLGNPHRKIPPTIHIAGTNGKGSTLAFLRAIFAEKKLKIHTYTSPHLVNFNERIVLAGQEISDDFLNKLLLRCKEASQIKPAIDVTFFEGVTVAAFLAFSEVKADLLLLEVGMGGRLDSTNVLEEVLCSVITPIAFDHQEFLGKTLSEIAFAKSGIIKKNCPVVIAKQKKSALLVIEKEAQKKGSHLVKVENFFKNLDQNFARNFTKKNWKNLKVSLSGDHQINNAKLAAACALTQKKFLITHQEIQSALSKAFWPARLQKITSGKFFEKLQNNSQLYLDGSHNLQGASTVKDFLFAQKNQMKKHNKKQKVFLIFAMLKDKNCSGFLKKIAKEVDQLIALEIPLQPNSRKAKDVATIAKKIGVNAIEAKNFEDAFAKINRVLQSELTHSKNSLILISGSLYLAGEFLKLNESSS